VILDSVDGHNFAYLASRRRLIIRFLHHIDCRPIIRSDAVLARNIVDLSGSRPGVAASVRTSRGLFGLQGSSHHRRDELATYPRHGGYVFTFFCSFVCLLAGLRKNYSTDFHKNIQ